MLIRSVLQQQGYDRLIASIRSDMQERHSIYSSLRVHIRSFFQEERHHVPPSRLYRDEKRCDAVLPCGVYRCSLSQQQSHHVAMSVLCRQEERCDPALISCLCIDSLPKECLHEEEISLRCRSSEFLLRRCDTAAHEKKYERTEN